MLEPLRDVRVGEPQVLAQLTQRAERICRRRVLLLCSCHRREDTDRRRWKGGRVVQCFFAGRVLLVKLRPDDELVFGGGC